MEPMKPMAPMRAEDPWWPSDLGAPATSGAQNGMRYAFFADHKRLLVQRDGTVTTYDTGSHDIRGVLQSGDRGGSATFTDGNGPIDLDTLAKIG